MRANETNQAPVHGSFALCLRTGALAAAAFVLLAACSEEKQEFRDFNTKTVRPGMPSIEARKRLNQQRTGVIEKAAKPQEDDGKLKLPPITEASFVEDIKTRDPFKPFVEIFERETQLSKDNQREVKLEKYDISELKLIGIITNIGNPMAMVVVPDGTGFVIKGGDYVGRAELVKVGSGDSIPLNWRVARIHGSGKEEERGVYLIRETAGIEADDSVEVTRFLPLYPNM